MKFSKKIVSFIFFTILMSTSYAEDARDYILKKISVFYGADSRRAERSDGKTKLPMSSIANSVVNPFNGNGNMANTWDLILKKIINDAQHGGDNQLQEYVAQIIKIRDWPVYIYFFDDNNPAWTEFWPHSKSILKDRNIGTLFIGCRYVNKYAGSNPASVLTVFLHELVHTQDDIEYNDPSFVIGSKWYGYGSDADHIVIEAVPAMDAAAKEGLANAIGMYFTDRFYNYKITDWYDPGNSIYVERMNLRKSSYPNKNADIWLYDKLLSAGVSSTGSSGDYEIYRLGDLPPYFIIHNELVISTMIFAYMQHVGYQKVLATIKEFNNNELMRSGGNLQSLMTIMCQAGLPDDMKSKSIDDQNFCSSSGDQKTYLLPLAYADYITGFKIASENEFNNLFDNGVNKQLVNCYWKIRDNVKKASLNSTQFLKSATEIAIALGVTSSK